MLVPGSLLSIISGKYNRFVSRGRNVSARNVFRYLYSIFMFATFLISYFRVGAFSAVYWFLSFSLSA